jgi:hypothetical protein
MTAPEFVPPGLHDALADAARAGVDPTNWLCPVCGEVVADELLPAGSPRPPSHEHYDRPVRLIKRAEL